MVMSGSAKSLLLIMKRATRLLVRAWQHEHGASAIRPRGRALGVTFFLPEGDAISATAVRS